MMGAADAVLITWNLLDNDHMAVLHNNIEISPTKFLLQPIFLSFCSNPDYEDKISGSDCSTST